MLSHFSGSHVNIYSRLTYIYIWLDFCQNELTQLIFHLSPAPDLHRCGGGRFGVNVGIFIHFLLSCFFKGKCLKHTNSQGQELKPHYGLATPFSPGVSA